MDLLQKPGFCQEFKKNWASLVPLILKYANKNPNSNASKALKYYPSTALSKSGGIKCT